MASRGTRLPARFAWTLGALTAWQVCPSASAHADGPAPPAAALVVSVGPDVSEVDPTALRADLAVELGVDVVASEDPRAANAEGVLEVSVDRDRREVVVVYRGHGTSITRRIALPGEPAAVERDVVLLAGNLARDEARDLVNRLRGSRPAPSEAPRPVVTAAAPQLDFAPEDAAEKRNLDALGLALEPHARDAGRAKVIGWTVALGGVAVMGVSVGLLVAKDDVAAIITDQVALGIFDATGLFMPGDFDPMLRVYRSERASDFPADVVVHDVVEEWRRRAGAERFRRRASGWVLTVTGGLSAAISIGFLATAHAPFHSLDDVATFGGFGLLGLASAGGGLSELLTLGPLESALRDYEGHEGTGATAGHAARLAPSVVPSGGPLPGGGFLGLVGRF